MAETLIISADQVRALTTISDNVDGNYLRPCIYEAQEIGLAEIIGSSLLEKLKELVADGSISNPANAAYKALVDKCQFYLAYRAVVSLIPKVSWKVGNFGLCRSTDENLREATAGEIDVAIKDWQNQADDWCRTIQRFVLSNRAAYPELNDCDANEIRATLFSAASCGVFLGGARGKIIRKGRCRR